MMNEADAQQFNYACARFHAGDYSEALDKLLELATRISDPWDSAELLYNEALFLLEMGRVAEARQRVSDLDKALMLVAKAPIDGDEFDAPVSLPVMAKHADLKVTIKEGKKLEAVRLIEDLIFSYPKQLALPQFRTMFEEVKTLRGLLLAELCRWDEAKSFLEDATPPEVWRNYHSYYLGWCYYELGDIQNARERLLEAINLGLSTWGS